jgi:hypothetical protein
MARKAKKIDDLSGYDYECPVYNRKDKSCAITLELCPRFNSDTKRSPDGNCKIRMDSFNQYLIDRGLTIIYKKEEEYEEIIEKVKVKNKTDDFTFV